MALKKLYELGLEDSYYLINIGFTTSTVDYNLFTLHISGTKLLVLVYVDDIIVICSSHSIIDDIISCIQSYFHVRHLSNLSYFLGIQAVRTP
jgi:hypothetical protein